MCNSDYKFIKKPNLPQNDVRHCVISNSDNRAVEFLEKQGIKTILVENSTNLEDEISSHTDLLFCYYAEKQAIISPNQPNLIKRVKELGCRVEVAEFEPFSPYPNDVLLNSAIINDCMICKTSSTSNFLLDFAKRNDVSILNSKQGYSKCSICIVNENAIITEDEGITKLLKNSQIEVLKIQDNFIRLSHEHSGFLGGASGKIGKDILFFNGNLEEHPSYESIVRFLSFYNVKPVYDKSYKLTDIGSIIPITEKN